MTDNRAVEPICFAVLSREAPEDSFHNHLLLSHHADQRKTIKTSHFRVLGGFSGAVGNMLACGVPWSCPSNILSCSKLLLFCGVFWGQSMSYLGESNVGGLLTEALTADVESVLADQTSGVGADTAVKEF